MPRYMILQIGKEDTPTVVDSAWNPEEFQDVFQEKIDFLESYGISVPPVSIFRDNEDQTYTPLYGITLKQHGGNAQPILYPVVSAIHQRKRRDKAILNHREYYHHLGYSILINYRNWQATIQANKRSWKAKTEQILELETWTQWVEAMVLDLPKADQRHDETQVWGVFEMLVQKGESVRKAAYELLIGESTVTRIEREIKLHLGYMASKTYPKSTLLDWDVDAEIVAPIST